MSSVQNIDTSTAIRGGQVVTAEMRRQAAVTVADAALRGVLSRDQLPDLLAMLGLDGAVRP